MEIPDYKFLSNLQNELSKSTGARKEFLQSKYDLYYSLLQSILIDNNLPMPRSGCTICYLYGWTTRAAKEAGLTDRTFSGAKLSI